VQAALTPTENQLPILVNKHLVTFCTVAVFLYALSRLWIGAKISAYFEAAFLLPFYYVVFKNWWYFKKQFLTWLVVAMLAIPILQFFVQYYQDPILALKYQGVDKLFRLTFFLAPAFWLAHNLKKINLFIGSNIIGFFILISIQDNTIHSIFNPAINERKVFEGFHHEFLATYSGVVILSCAYLISSLPKSRPLKSLALKSLLVSGIIISIYFIAISQTRAIYLGLSMVFITLFVIYNKNHLIKLFSILSFITLSFTVFNTNVADRFTSEAHQLTSSLRNNQIPENSIGYRISLWKIGIDNITDKPLIGHGGKGNKASILKTSDLSYYFKYFLHHYHNSFIEFGVAFGIFGVLIVLLIPVIALYYARRKQTPKRSPLIIYSMTLLMFLYFINLFESYLFFWQGGYLLAWSIIPFASLIFSQITLSSTKLQ